MSDKIYCGNAKIVSTQYGDLTKISMSKSDINSMVSYMKENSLEWINLNLKEKQNKVEGKPSHYLEVDTWKPDASKSTASKSDGDDDLPF